MMANAFNAILAPIRAGVVQASSMAPLLFTAAMMAAGQYFRPVAKIMKLVPGGRNRR
jgi:hypothetical protein